MAVEWKTYNKAGENRIVVTKPLPGKHWLDILQKADHRVEVCQSETTLSRDMLIAAIGDYCAGVIGQLTEEWNADLFARLAAVGGKVYSNYAVGYDNVDVPAATTNGIAVGNTPGVLTETTAELAVALTFAAARRVAEADQFMRAGSYHGWLPDLFLGELVRNKTVGVVGAGRIGTAYARMMVEGHHTNLVYYDPSQNTSLESAVEKFNQYLQTNGEEGVVCRRAESLGALLQEADIVSLHPVLNQETRHLIGARELALMKEHAVLINVSRGPIIDEQALVSHCQIHPDFRVGLDVYEAEPEMALGLNELQNVVIVPHIGSATRWTREGMAILAARNVTGVLQQFPVWDSEDMRPFLSDDAPRAIPSILNRQDLGLPTVGA